MTRFSRFSSLSVVLALTGLFASLSVGCLCGGMPAAGGSMQGMPAMPEMSGHCHAEAAGAGLSAPCCCAVAPRDPAVAESLRTPYLPERPAVAGLPTIEPLVFMAPGRPEPNRLSLGSIDRSPPTSSTIPLRI